MIAVPQADDIGKVLGVVDIIDGDTTSADIASHLDMVERQGLYYLTAAAILGLVDVHEHIAQLTPKGEQLKIADLNTRRQYARNLIMDSDIVAHVLKGLGVEQPDFEKHHHLLEDTLWVQDAIEDLGYAPETAMRRARTLKAWMEALT